jgi:formylglycine-generating enzyme required for sulfatase activity/serine/threonine protein kinase
MGAVYVVDQLSTGKQRALKLMAPELVHNPEVRERFVREARAAANIESDHVVETVTAGVDQETGAPYIVMELLRGEELADAVARTGPLPVADVAEVLEQIGHALEQAHRTGLVHRDLKPENVFLCVSKRREAPFTAKILDFGIAKLVADGMQKTGTQPLGSPLYMSPEQTDRKGRICPATDVWALGLIAFYLLTGRSYWREAEGDSLQILLREIIVDPLSAASERATEMGVQDKLPAGFDAWFARCVERDIDKRFPEAGAAVRAFAELAASMPRERKLVISTQSIDASSVPAASAPGLELAPTAYIPDVTGPSPDRMTTGSASASVRAAASSPPAKRSPAIFAIGALAVAGLAAGIYFVAKGPNASPASSAAPAATSAPVVGATASATASAAASSSYAPPVAPADPRCQAGMIFHEGGMTVMGAKDMPDYTEARTTHEIQISPYCLDQTEVTVRAYEACVKEGKCERTPDDVDYEGITPEAKSAYKPFCNARKADRLDHPINCVDWDMATKYCAWKGGRLPTEAEWEFAARGSEQRDFPWGSDTPGAKHLNGAGKEFAAWSEKNAMKPGQMHEEDDGFVGTSPVGTFQAGATPAGVHDLAGNVFEWTADWFGPYTPARAVDPKGPPAGEKRVARGGAFNAKDATWVRAAYRWGNVPHTYNHGIGFRCAAAPSAGDKN